MKNKFLLIIFFSAVFFVQQVSAQTYCIPVSGGVVNYTSSGSFFDSGCSAGNYSANENGYMVICPTFSCMLSLTLVSLNLSDAGDTLRLHSGGPGGPLLGTFIGPVVTTIPAMFTSSDVSGCLTAMFTSNASGQQSGWEMTIGCQLSTSINKIEFVPVENNLSLNLSSPSSFTLNIFSADGKKISEKNYSLGAGQHQLELPTENLPQGIYFCRVAGEGINKSFKFIK
jgi:hypothetical protein